MAMLIDAVRAVITPDVVRGASQTIGEDPTAVQNTLNTAVPSVLAGALGQSSTLSGAERLRTMITDGRFGDAAGGVSRLIGGGPGADTALRSGEGVVSSLFGNRADRVYDALANAGGVRRNSASTLLSMVAPIVMSVLARKIASGNLDARGLMNMLSGERDAILRGLPPGLGRELGVDRVTAETHRPEEHVHERERVRSAEPRRVERTHVPHERARLRPLLFGGLAALALLFFLTRDRDRREERVEAPPAAEMPAPQPAPAPAPQPPMTQPAAPSAAQPAAPISELAVFLTSGTSARGPRSFLLEGIAFESGSARLTPESRSTINSVADVLVAHPNTQVRIEGHTDAQGDAGANRSLSLERANAVKQAMVARGVGAGQITTKGVGPDRPVASNDTETGRMQNRRTELVVIQRTNR
jgi:outer membrane protein OmpA-like peptidoglycan-associated protein